MRPDAERSLSGWSKPPGRAEIGEFCGSCGPPRLLGPPPVFGALRESEHRGERQSGALTRRRAKERGSHSRSIGCHRAGLWPGHGIEIAQTKGAGGRTSGRPSRNVVSLRCADASCMQSIYFHEGSLRRGGQTSDWNGRPERNGLAAYGAVFRSGLGVAFGGVYPEEGKTLNLASLA